MVKISIIMPIFNDEKHLKKSINSVINQSLDDIELICVDDGSTDNSLNILNYYKEKDIRIKIYKQENKGTGAARNLGLKHVKGKYILFIDSDDWFDVDSFELLYNMAENLNPDLILFNSVEHKFNNQLKKRIYFHLNDKFDFNNFTFDYHFKNNNLVMNSFFVPWSKLYKTKFLLDNNIKFSEIPIFNDMYFNVVVTMLASKIAYCPKILYHYNKLNESSIQTKIKSNKNAFVILDVYKNIEDFLRKNNFYNELELNFLSSKFREYSNVLKRVHENFKEELFYKIKEDFKNLELSNKNIFKELSLKDYSFYIHILNSDSFLEFNKFNSLSKIDSDILNKSVLNSHYVDTNYVDFFKKTLDNIKILNLFDKDYYINKYDYKGLNPLLDYLCNGVIKDYNPSKRFNTKFYLKYYHIGSSNPLVYFVNKGYFEGKVRFNSSIHNIKSINKLKLKDDISNFNEVGIRNNVDINENIIVSLTSFPDRMDDICYCLYSLLNQSFKPDKIILWLSQDDFPNKEKDIPKQVLNLKKNGLSIKWCKNYYSYKKLIPSLREYPNSCIITADDDLYYPKDWLKNLYEDHTNYPGCIISSRCRIIPLKEDNGLKEYKYWKLATNNNSDNISFLNFPTNGAGSLFPPYSLNKKVMDVDLFTELCPHADDMWFWAMAVLNKTKIKKCKKLIPDCTYVNPYREIFSENTLWHENSKGRNDIQLNNILNKFPSILKIIKDDK